MTGYLLKNVLRIYQSSQHYLETKGVLPADIISEIKCHLSLMLTQGHIFVVKTVLSRAAPLEGNSAGFVNYQRWQADN